MKDIPTTKHKFFFYGSLRKGDYNHMDSEPDSFATLRNYKMYSLRAYPFITRSNNHKDVIIGEIYSNLTEEQVRWIDSMEIGAGYDRELLMVTDEMGKEHEVVVYSMDVTTDREESLTQVEDGDWLVFKNKKKNKSLEEY